MAVECSAIFTDGIQNNNNSGYLTFYSGAKVINSPDNILDSKRNIVDYSGGGNCDGVSCGSSFNIAQSVNFDDFTNNSNNVYVVTGEQTITPGDYNHITLASGATLTLTAGDYKLNGDLTLYSSSQIEVSGSGVVRIFVKNNINIHSSAEVNTAGNSTKLLLYGKKYINFYSAAKVTASVYSKENVYLNSGAVVNGSISGKHVTLYSSSTVNFNRSEPNFGDFCSGTPNAILVSDWRMDEDDWQGTADEIADSSGHNYHGNAISASTSSGFICNAADLSATGTADYLSLDHSAINGLKDFTLSAWVNTTRRSGQTILSVANSSQFNEAVFYYENNTTFYPTIRENSFNPSTKTTVSNFSTGTWKHHVWTRKTHANNGELCLYIDNVLQGCSTHNNGEFAIDVDATGFILGQEQDSLGGGFDSSQAFSGLLDEVLLFDGILSTTEINEINNNQIQGKNWDGTDRSCGPIEPIADWRMDEDTWQGSAGEVIDDSGNGYHGKAVSTDPIDGFICNAADLSATGTDDYLSLDHTAIDGLNNFTVSAWVKTSRTGGQALMSVANSTQFNEALFFYGNNTTFYPTIRENSFNPSTQNPVSNISTDSWKHHVWIRKTYVNNGEVCLYIDNVFEGCSTHNNGEFSLDVDATGFILGQEQDSLGGGFDSSQAFSGLLDEVLLFDKALSVNDINNIYNNQVQGKNWDGTERSCGPPEPIAEWRMDEQAWDGSTGEVLSELGTLHGTAFGGLSTDRINPARSGNPGTCGYGDFDGIDDYVEITDESAFDLAEQLTVSAWIYPQSLPSTDLMSIVSKDENYEFHLTPSGEIHWWWNLGNFYTSGAGIVPGEWHHIAITYKDGEQFIYVNGSALGSSTYSGNLALNDLPLQIGQDQGHPGRYFHGSIDEVRVYDGALSAGEVLNVFNETHPCEMFIDHFQIDTRDAQGITCQADEIIIKACADASCNMVNAQGGVVRLNINGGFYKEVAVSGSEGTVTSYPYTSVGNVILSLDEAYKCTNNLNSTSCNVDFKDSGFIISDIPMQISGKSSGEGFNGQTLSLKAVETDTTNGACVGVFPDDTDVAVNLSYTCAGGDCKDFLMLSNNGNSYNLSETASARDLYFSNNSTAIFTLKYPHAGKFIINAQKDVEVTDSDNNIIIKDFSKSSNAFVERPFGIKLDFTNDDNGSNAHAQNGSGVIDTSASTFKKAGETFTLTATAMQWVSGQDLTGESGIPDGIPDDFVIFNQNTLKAENFSGGEITVHNLLLLPVSGNNPNLNIVQSNSFSGNTSSLNNQYSFGEVGIIELKSKLKTTDYLGAGDIFGQVTNVGRFYPDHFVQTIESGNQGNLVANHDSSPILACSALDWVYTGQITDSEGSIRYDEEPILTITANNVDGVKTLNYIDDFAKFSYLNTDTNNKITFSQPLTKHANLLPLQGDVSGIGTITVQSGGLLTYQLPSQHHYVYTRNSASKVVPFKANFELPFDEFKDSDEVTFKVSNGSTHYFQNPHFYQLDAIPPDVTDFDNTVEVRFGRWLLENSYAPETSPLPVTMFTQYFDGTDFINNDKESCLVPSVGTKDPVGEVGDGGMVLWNYRLDDVGEPDNLLPSHTTPGVEAKSFEEGVYQSLFFSAPGVGRQGSLLFEYQVPPWLQYDWNNDTNFTNNPTAKLTFGIFRGNDRIIYQREIEK